MYPSVNGSMDRTDNHFTIKVNTAVIVEQNKCDLPDHHKIRMTI